MEKVIEIYGDNLATLKYKRSDHPKYLNDLIASLSVCEENYKRLANESAIPELKEVADKLALERSEFVLALKEDFLNGSQRNQNALSKIKPLWGKLTKGVIHSKDEQAVIDILLKSELNAITKYNTYLYYHIPTIERLNVLLAQKKALNDAIELFKADYILKNQEINFLMTDVA
jgi:hypothetical protein